VFFEAAFKAASAAIKIKNTNRNEKYLKMPS
jgi:hypothetical protein